MEAKLFQTSGKMREKKPNNRPTIAFLTHNLTDAYGHQLWAGAMEAAREAGANLVCYPGWALRDSRDSNAQANIVYDLVNPENLDGLVISSGILSNSVGIAGLQQFCDRFHQIPMASIAVKLDNYPSIMINNYEGMKTVVAHLIEDHNLTRLAFISGPQYNEEALLRYQGYQETLKKHGIDLDPYLVSLPTNWDDVSGREAMNFLLDERKLTPGKDFQAVVNGSDNTAAGALEVLLSRGYKIPEDVAITGFDGQERSNYLFPPLTTVYQPLFRQAYEATRAVLAQIRGESVPPVTYLETELVIRQSCNCQSVAILKAESGLTHREPGKPRMALTFHRKKLISELVDLRGSAHSLAAEEAEQLITAWFNEITGNSQGSFLAKLGELLQATAQDQDLFFWQELISVMRRSLLPYLDVDERLFRAENLWQQARVLISEAALRALGSRRLHAEQREIILGEINKGMVTTSNDKEMFSVLIKGLQRLNISGCYLALYSNPSAPLEGCQVRLAYQDGKLTTDLVGKQFAPQRLILEATCSKKEPATLVVEPLYYDDNQLGFALLELGPKDGMVYETLRSQLSSMLWAMRLNGYLRQLYEASLSILALSEPQQILADIVERACSAVGAKSAKIILTDTEGHPQSLAFGGNRESSFSTSMLVSSEPVLIENTQDETAFPYSNLHKEGFGAAGCFPIISEGKSIGLMWVLFEKPHHFSMPETEALSLYVNLATVAYENANRMKALEHIHGAIAKFASMIQVRDVLQEIVNNARGIFNASSAVFWPYDAVRGVFLADELVGAGVAPEIIEKYKQDKPSLGGTAELVMKRGYVEVTDVNSPEYVEIGPIGRGLRGALGTRSFQGIPLQIQDECLGVLYVNYTERRGFQKNDRSTFITYTHHAALALKKARLLEKVNNAHKTAQIVAKVSVLNSLQQILEAVAVGTRDALGCDVVTLYTYDGEDDEIGFPPAMVGVKHEDQVLELPVARNSLIYRVLQLDEPHVALDAPTDPLVGGPFVDREDIKTSISIPLKVGEQRVGVMFVNYHSKYNIPSDELEDIRLFSSQAAVAIWNAQLYENATKRAAYLQMFYEANNALSGTLALQEIYKRIVESAWNFSGRLGKHARIATLSMAEENRLRIKAAYPRENQQTQKNDIPNEIIGGKHKRIVQAYKSGLSQLSGNVSSESQPELDELPTRSILVVPIKINETVIGVITVEHSDQNVFDYEDQQAMEALAAQAAISLENARLYKEAQQRALQLATASKVARDATATLDVTELYENTVKLISERFGYYHVSLFMLDNSGEQAILQAATSTDGQRMLTEGYKLKIGVGIVGYVAQHRQPRISNNVQDDPYFYNNPQLPTTRSEMGLPLAIKEKLIGVLDVQSDKLGAFTNADQETLQILADQLAIAIENARQYQELEETKGKVGARTALAWMGMISSSWRHTIEKHARTIVEQTDFLRDDLPKNAVSKDHSSVEGRLSMIQRLARQIEEKPITPPLSSEEGVVSVNLNGLISERTKQLWENEPYKGTLLVIELNCTGTVRASPEWLRRALDILIDNGIKATTEAAHRQIRITTDQEGEQIKILVQDTGTGMSEPISQQLFKEPIEKPKGAKGLGVGLLMAQVIIQTYGGDIGLSSTSPTGTEMFIRLPLEQ